MRVLDIGGGYGFFASELKRQFPSIEVQVMEPSPKRAEMGRDYLQGRSQINPVPSFVIEPLDDAFVERNRGYYDIITM